MKKRLLSWLLVLTMVTSLIPSTLVTTAFAADNTSAQASGQAGKTTVKVDNKWPVDMNADITDVLITGTTIPGPTLTVEKGKTLIVHGSGTLSGDGRRDGTPFFIVKDGGHLVLDNVTVTANSADAGTVVVEKGGLLDLGYNDQKDRVAPSITGNTTTASAARNLVVGDGATVRLNAEATKKIGIYYGNDLGAPFAIIQSGRYTLQDTDLSDAAIYSDHADYILSINYRDIYVTRKTPKVLFIDPGARATATINGIVGQGNYVFRAYSGASALVANLRIAVQDTFRGVHSATIRNSINATVEYKEYESPPGTDYKNGTYSFDDLNNIMQYDVIFINGAWGKLTADGRKNLIDYLNAGGCIYFQAEDTQTGFDGVRAATNVWMQDLGATGFAAMGSPSGAGTLNAWKDTGTDYAKRLTENMPNNWHVEWTAPIKTGNGIEPLFWATFRDGSTNMWAASYLAGEREDGAKYGRLIAITDGNWVAPASVGDANYCGNIAGQFFTNLLRTTRENRITAAAGYNPNAEITYEATTKATNYRTPYAALQKAVEGNTVTLLTKSNTAVTPTRDELLFEQSTLAYEAGSTYAGSTIHADTAGVYLDITKTGAVNLRSGTVTVTPKDATYPLVLNGTMDQDGTAITGGYKITATGAYTLDADDDTTKIKTGNGGGASITIPKAGTSVTVAYTGGTDGKLNGKTITYTATEDNEKFYLGCYTVSYEVEGNVTWTETDLAWDGHEFVTKMNPASGYDAHGEKLAVVDIANAKTYDMENGVTEGTGVETWGVFNSKTKLKNGATPKITVKQQYLHENNVDRNGYATVTVRNVREDITIRTTGNAVESSRPNIYVVGVGVKDGQRTQLWAYTTQRTTDDQITTKDVEGWPWAKWKVVSAKTAKGTQAAYEGNQITTWTNETIKNSTTAGGALCPVELTHGDMVVVFEYEWDMVNVKINAKLGEGNTAVDFPGYTTQYAEVQRNVESTIYAPNLSGYQPTAASTTITPTAGQDGTYGPYEVTFYYKLAMGQVIYRAVDADGHELATWDGPRVLQGDTVSTDYALAPKLAGYQVKPQNGNATAANSGTTDKYDGVNQITVTWVYEPKTRDVEVKMVEYDASKPNNIGAELRTDTTSYAKSPVGFTLNLSAPAIPGYTVKEVADNDEISKSKSVFVEDNDQGKLTVYFYYEVNTQDDAKITVQMWDKVNNEEIWSYTVPGQNGEKQLVRVPAVKGYVSDPSNKDTSIAPDDTLNADWGKGTVRFLYSPNTVKVTVKLVDSTKTVDDTEYELNSKLTNYSGSFTVVKGESIDIVAPDIYGYTLADGQESVHKLTVDKNESQTELTYTINYIPANDGQVFVHVKGLDKDGTLCYEYTNSVTQGTASVDVTAFAVSGQKLTAATVDTVNKFSDVHDGALTVDTSAAAKGSQIEVVFTYGDNTADVTINAYYEGTTDTVEGFTPFTVKAEIGKPYSYGALSLPGYDNADQTTPSLTKVTGTKDHIDYHFTKQTGNVIYRLVEDGNENHVLATKSDTVAKGAVIDAAAANAPTATNWKLKDASAAGKITDSTSVTVTTYDGVHAVTVTYVAVPKTKTVTIRQMDVDTDKGIGTKTVELETGRLHTLQKVDYLPDNGKYTISGLKTVEIYVEDDNQARSVNMYFRRSTDEDVTVNLVYTDEQNQKQTIQTYLVQRKPGTTITVKAPDMAYKGYTAKQNSVDVQPTQNSVEIEYTVTYYDITIKLLDENDRNLTTPTGYETNRKVRKGEGIVLTAPSIADYTLASTLVVSKTADELADAANRTITFKYKNTASANYVTHTIKLMDADTTPATLITQYNSVVTKGNGTTTYLAPLQDGYQVDKKSQEISNAASQDVVFNYTKSAATITIHFVDTNGTTLNGYENGQILTGYEKGQTVMVAAPAVSGKALAGLYNATAQGDKVRPLTGVTTIVTIPTDQPNVEVTFAYKEQGTYKFRLVDQAGTEIKTVTGENGTFSTTTGGNLDLTDSGWKFDHANKGNTAPFNAENAELKIGDNTTVKEYTLYYTRMTRPVTYKYVDVTDGQRKDINFTGTTNNPQTTNVGENLITSAPQIPGYTPNALRDVTFVMTGTDAVTVTFEYIKKATGSITVVHKLSGSDKVITSYTVSGSVGEWFTATKLATNDATGITTDGKYKFTESTTNQATQSVQYTADAQTLTFVYEANYVTVNTFTSVDGQKTAYETGIEVVKTSGSQKLYAPSKTGYVLKGIEVTKGSTTDGSAKSFPATGWQDNTLTLTGLNENVEVVYYYEKINDNIKEYQATVKVTDKYESYTLGTWEETVTKDVSSKLTPKAHDGYALTGYQIGDATEVTVAKDQAANFVLTHKFTADTNVTFFYARTDGSAVVPGKDGNFGTKDDVVIKPNGDQLPKVNDDKTVSVPEGGEVVTPNGTVIPPNGSIVKPDGTIVAPGTDGTTNPGVTIDPSKPDSAAPTYLYVKYMANGGKGEIPTLFFKKGDNVTIAANTFTADNKTANGWNTQEDGKGTDYAAGSKQLNASLTLFAKWTANNYAESVTITFHANLTGVQDEQQTIGFFNGTSATENLRANTFVLNGWTFGGWSKQQVGSIDFADKTAFTFKHGDDNTLNLYAQWYKVNADGSITVPGEDGNPKNEATNATAKGNGTTAPTRNDKGEIEVPKGGSVTLPDGSVIGMPDGGKLLPNGTVIINRPDKDGNGKTDDGTITIPGKTDPTKPDVTDKNGQPEADAKVIELVYQINDGKSHDEVTVKVVKGDTVSILDCPFTWAGHQFVNWMGTDNKEYASGANYTAGDNDLELHAQWVKVNDDGSIELPGKDGSMTTPEDNVLVTPDKPNGTVTKQPDGSAKVEGNSGTVNRPKDPDHPDQGKENIKVPDGTIVKPDGTIVLPDNGGTINPGDKFPGATPADYISVVYKANGGTGDDEIDLIKTGQTIKAKANPFTNGNQTFNGWNTAENGVGGKTIAAGAEITIPNNSNSITLYAQWSNATYKHSAKITYQANDGKTDAIEDTVGANDSTKFSINLRSNPFSVSGWDFGGWNTEANGTGTLKAANAVVEVTANNDQTWYAQWYKVGANGSITVPGDGNPNTTDNNVTANGTGVTRDPDTGNISITAGNVVKGNETIALPNGGTLKPDGSLSINKPNGGGQIEVKPDGSTDPNANVVTLTYEANNGTNDTRKVYATKGEEIAPLAANTFSYIGHAFLYWKSGDTIFKTNGTIIPTDAMTLSAVWAKVNNDGSIELPGKDGELESPKDKDNVLVTPDKPDGKVTPQPDGSVKVEDNGGTVTRPTDPKHPENGKEEIKVPEGTVVKPDGTIKLPDGTEIAPDKRIPDDVTPTNYFVVTYEPGDGSGDVIRDVITKNADTTLRDEDTFTAPNGKIFDGWLDGAQTKYDAGDTLTVSESMTFTAQWKDKNPDTTVYPVTITYHSGNDTKTQRETGSSKQFSATLNANSFTAPATDWTFMGWTTDANGGKNGTFYKDGGTIALDVTNPDPDLYAVWYHKDDTTGTITLPGKDNDPTTADNNVTVNPGNGTAPTVKNDSNEGYIEANGGNIVQQPAGTITVIDGPVKVYPDGTVFVPAGSKVTDKDGNEVTGPATIDPDGNVEPGKKDDPKKDDADNSIIIPGKDGFIDPPHDKDNLIVKPDGNGNQTGSIDNSTGDTTITAPDGADVSVPGKNPPDTRADIKLPQGTVIKPDGTIILPDDKNGKDENGGTIPGGSEIDPDGVVTYRYTVVYLDSSNNALRAPTFLKLKAGETGNVTAPEITGYTVSGSATKTVEAKAGDTYTVTFIYTKNSTGGGSSSGGGGGGGGSSTVSSYTIKASAGNGGNISPSGNVTVKRGEDQSFHINPINGYRISDVIVDGKSVGAVSTYTFDSVKANHTIQVKFVKYNSIVADPEVTGVAGWLQTKEHNGYMGGYGNGLFGPNDNMTRAQAARMFYNLLLEKDVPVTASFTDVPADAWYAEAVNTLASLGIIKGIGDGQFAPNRTITRAEFTVIAMRFANVSADVTNPFTDIATNDWYYTAVTSAVSYGWINGYSDGSFRPQATITRAEVVTIVNRMLNRTADRNFVDSNVTAQFDDVPNTYWAYYNIMEATIAHDHSIDNDGVESWGKQK